MSQSKINSPNPTWCEPLKLSNGHYVFGGAARNVRIANFGGMPSILRRVFDEASTLRQPQTLAPSKVVQFRRKYV